MENELREFESGGAVVEVEDGVGEEAVALLSSFPLKTKRH